jgi:DNA-binding NtrC family response regulator
LSLQDGLADIVTVIGLGTEPRPFLQTCHRSTCYAVAKTRGIGFAEAAGMTQDNSVAPAATILLVDDDVELLKALTKVLEKENYSVVAEPDAASAVKYINSTQKKFDLVLTDVSMPGMKGTAFLTAVKTAFPRIPVIMITAFGDWGQYMDAVRNGAFEYLSKPLDKAELLAAVRRALTNGARRNNHGATASPP